MRMWRTGLVGAGLLIGLTACGQKSVTQVDSAAAPAAPAKATTAAPAADAKPVNTKCPVMGGDVDPKVTTTWQGKTVAFCCTDCVAKFNADPAKYAAKLTPDAQAKASDMGGMDHGKMQGMDHSKMPMDKH